MGVTNYVLTSWDDPPSRMSRWKLLTIVDKLMTAMISWFISPIYGTFLQPTHSMTHRWGEMIHLLSAMVRKFSRRVIPVSKWIITIVIVRALRIGLWDLFQIGDSMACKQGWSQLITYKSSDDPPG